MTSSFDVHGWLNQTLTSGQILHRRLSFLVTANGGFDVRGWGCISSGNGHQQGLEQNDALELIYWDGFISGLVAAGVNFHDAFYPIFQSYQQEHMTPAEPKP